MVLFADLAVLFAVLAGTGCLDALAVGADFVFTTEITRTRRYAVSCAAEFSSTAGFAGTGVCLAGTRHAEFVFFAGIAVVAIRLAALARQA